MSDKFKLLVHIDGITMEFEAWELIRLFFDEDSIKFIHDGDPIDDFSGVSFLAVKAEENEDGWSCKTAYYPDVVSLDKLEKARSCDIRPQYHCEKLVIKDDLGAPGGRLLKSQKILVGASIVNVLEKVTGKELPYGSLTGVRPVKLAMMCLQDGMDREDTVKQLRKATSMSENKAKLLYDVAEAECPYIYTDDKMVHLYIGIPFCASRCLYCSFTSYSIQRYQYLVPEYLKCLEKEIRFTAEMINQNHLMIGSVYIGGGTPTSIDASSIAQLLKSINENFNLDGIEFTLEAGRPDTITKEKLEAIKEGKVSRISINPQTMNLETLRLIGRNHTPEDIEEKFHLARQLGFHNINMDLIAGLPGEDEAMFRYTLDRIEKLAPESLTVHTMAVKRASRLHEDKESYSSASDETVEAMIEAARISAAKMGMRPYYLYRQKNILANLENTGYAKPGLECLYNINTMEEYQTVFALGAGAISKYVANGKIERSYNVKEVTQYIARIDEMLARKVNGYGSK